MYMYMSYIVEKVCYKVCYKVVDVDVPALLEDSTGPFLCARTMSNFAKRIVSGTVMCVFCLSTLCLASQIRVDDVSRRFQRQVTEENGITISEWWVKALYRLIPWFFKDEKSIPTPIMFLPYTDAAVVKILKSIFGWWPKLVFEDNGPFTIHTVPMYIFGVNAFELVGISFLVFLASIALVVIILPSLYFRLMLFADYVSTNEVPSLLL